MQQIGTPYELYFRPENVFVAGFIGEPPMNFLRGEVQNGCLFFGENRLDLSKKLPGAAAWEGKSLVFGFRPEAVRLGECPEEEGYALRCNVELTEMLGDNTNVYVTSGEDQAILKVDSHDTPEMDRELRFSIPYEGVYLFDGETERVIRP